MLRKTVGLSDAEYELGILTKPKHATFSQQTGGLKLRVRTDGEDIDV